MTLFDAFVSRLLEPFAAWLAVQRRLSCWRVLQHATAACAAVLAGMLAAAAIGGRLSFSSALALGGLLIIGVRTIIANGRTAKLHEAATRMFPGSMNRVSNTIPAVVLKASVLAVLVLIIYLSTTAGMLSARLIPKIASGAFGPDTANAVIAIAAFPFEIAFSLLVLTISPMLSFCIVPPLSPPGETASSKVASEA